MTSVCLVAKLCVIPYLTRTLSYRVICFITSLSAPRSYQFRRIHKAGVTCRCKFFSLKVHIKLVSFIAYVLQPCDALTQFLWSCSVS